MTDLPGADESCHVLLMLCLRLLPAHAVYIVFHDMCSYFGAAWQFGHLSGCGSRAFMDTILTKIGNSVVKFTHSSIPRISYSEQAIGTLVTRVQRWSSCQSWYVKLHLMP